MQTANLRIENTEEIREKRRKDDRTKQAVGGRQQTEDSLI
jgi:hypothetical protein